MATDWREAVEESVRRFIRATGVTRGDLAKALGLYDAALYPSHLKDPRRGDDHKNRILFSLNGRDLFRVAGVLGLDDRGFEALKGLCIDLYRDVLGLDIDFGSPRATLNEAVEMGGLAFDQFEHDQWDVAVPRLQRAWGVLAETPLCDTTQVVTIRVGMQLATWENAQANPAGALRIVRHLLPFARAYRGNDPQTLGEIASLFSNAAMAERLQKLGSPGGIVQKLQAADEVCRSLEGGLLGRVGAYRDMAKPYLSWGVGWRGRPADVDRVRDAEAVAQESERLAGGLRPIPGMHVPWLLSRFSRIEVLAASPQGSGRDEARRLWDAAMGMGWAADLMAEPKPTILKATGRFAVMATCLAQNDLESLAAHAHRFATDPANSAYRDRINKAQKLTSLALAGDIDGARNIFTD